MPTKKTVKKVTKKTTVVKKDVCPCGCGCGADCPCMNGGNCGCGCCAGDSVKYTRVWAAWRAFWRRGYCEWAGTSSRSEYWLSWIGNIIVLLGWAAFIGLMSLLETGFYGTTALLTWLSGALVVLYLLAMIIPAISMMTRRMHDAGLSAWLWLLYIASAAPAYVEGSWVYGPSVGLIVSLLPTQVKHNRFHQYNK